jgi:hypothetical protein
MAQGAVTRARPRPTDCGALRSTPRLAAAVRDPERSTGYVRRSESRRGRHRRTDDHGLKMGRAHDRASLGTLSGPGDSNPGRLVTRRKFLVPILPRETLLECIVAIANYKAEVRRDAAGRDAVRVRRLTFPQIAEVARSGS